MKKLFKMASVAVCAAVMMCTEAFADNSSQVRNLLNDGQYISWATEASENNGTPKFFVHDMNNDGNLEIYVLAGNVRFHYQSSSYLISFVNGKPQTTSYAGDIFYGYNPETGIFANAYSGMGYNNITVSRLNSDGTVSNIHKINAAFGVIENNNKNLVYYIQVDDGKKNYFDTEEAMKANLESMLGYYELEVPTTYDMYAGNYEAAINAAYTEVVGGRG